MKAGVEKMEFVTRKKGEIRFHPSGLDMKLYIVDCRINGDRDDIQIYEEQDGHALYMGTDQGAVYNNPSAMRELGLVEQECWAQLGAGAEVVV